MIRHLLLVAGLAIVALSAWWTISMMRVAAHALRPLLAGVAP